MQSLIFLHPVIIIRIGIVFWKTTAVVPSGTFGWPLLAASSQIGCWQHWRQCPWFQRALQKSLKFWIRALHHWSRREEWGFILHSFAVWAESHSSDLCPHSHADRGREEVCINSIDKTNLILCVHRVSYSHSMYSSHSFIVQNVCFICGEEEE